VVGVYDDVLRSPNVPLVGHDPSRTTDDDWPPPYPVLHRLTGRTDLHDKGMIRRADEHETRAREPAAVWVSHHLVDRLMGIQRGTDHRRKIDGTHLLPD
jgi:hypothetical protein